MDDVSVHSITEDTVYVHGLIYSAVILIWHFGIVFNFTKLNVHGLYCKQELIISREESV